MLFILLIYLSNLQGQNQSSYTSELVVSIYGESSYEKRGSPRLFPIKKYIEIKQDSLFLDSLLVKVHFIECNDTTSDYFLSTLFFYEKSIENDRRRDVYKFDKFVTKINKKPNVSDWIRVAKNGGLYISQVSKCGLIREVGVFW